jgi:hypothetical protein
MALFPGLKAGACMWSLHHLTEKMYGGHHDWSGPSTDKGTERIQPDNGYALLASLYSADYDLLAASQLFKQNTAVAFVGHPGTGKSVEMSVVLFSLLRELAQVAQGTNQTSLWRRVFLRVGLQLYQFSIYGRTIRCDVIPGVGECLVKVERYMDGLGWTKDSILLLELEGVENWKRIPLYPFPL